MSAKKPPADTFKLQVNHAGSWRDALIGLRLEQLQDVMRTTADLANAARFYRWRIYSDLARQDVARMDTFGFWSCNAGLNDLKAAA